MQLYQISQQQYTVDKHGTCVNLLYQLHMIDSFSKHYSEDMTKKKQRGRPSERHECAKRWMAFNINYGMLVPVVILVITLSALSLKQHHAHSAVGTTNELAIRSGHAD